MARRNILFVYIIRLYTQVHKQAIPSSAIYGGKAFYIHSKTNSIYTLYAYYAEYIYTSKSYRRLQSTAGTPVSSSNQPPRPA